jgi:hypothetical protein
MDGTHECIPTRAPGQLFFVLFSGAGTGVGRFCCILIQSICNQILTWKIKCNSMAASEVHGRAIDLGLAEGTCLITGTGNDGVWKEEAEQTPQHAWRRRAPLSQFRTPGRRTPSFERRPSGSHRISTPNSSTPQAERRLRASRLGAAILSSNRNMLSSNRRRKGKAISSVSPPEIRACASIFVLASLQAAA